MARPPRLISSNKTEAYRDLCCTALLPPWPVRCYSIDPRAEQHSESQLPKCFKAFANGHQTKAARADQHTESEEQNYLRNQSSRHRSRENRCCDGAQSDPEQ